MKSKKPCHRDQYRQNPIVKGFEMDRVTRVPVDLPARFPTTNAAQRTSKDRKQSPAQVYKILFMIQVISMISISAMKVQRQKKLSLGKWIPNYPEDAQRFHPLLP